MAAAGSAIGLGNIWRFPVMAAKSGGAAFVLVYLGFVLVIGVPVLVAELSLGRATQSSAVGAFRRAVPNTRWGWIGGLGVVTGFGILAFYCVVAGWTLSYLGRAATGVFSEPFDPERSEALFRSIIASPLEPMAMATCFMALTAVIVRGGIAGGIERASKLLMPAFFVLLLLLAARSLTLPGASEGVAFLVRPDFGALEPRVYLFALGQALFSLSLGMGAMITYGSYLRKDTHVWGAGVAVAVFDTAIALLAGLIIFPALFSAGASPTGGPGLVFVVLPTIFHTLPAGPLFAFAFYALLAIAALTSTISLLEVVVAYFVDERTWPRERAVWVVAGCCLLLAIPSALSQGAHEGLSTLAGVGFLDLQNAIFGNIALSVGAFLISLFVGWIWGIDRASQELPESRMRGAWGFLLRYVCPVAVIAVLAFIAWTREFF